MLLPSSAFAAGDGDIAIEIQVDGKPYLVGSRRHSESRLTAEVWRYMTSADLNPVDGVQVSPEPENPLKATLRGSITISIENGGTAVVNELHLIRRAADAVWTVDPADVEQIALKMKNLEVLRSDPRMQGVMQSMELVQKMQEPPKDDRWPGQLEIIHQMINHLGATLLGVVCAVTVCGLFLLLHKKVKWMRKEIRFPGSFLVEWLMQSIVPNRRSAALPPPAPKGTEKIE
jgi:hypothetical protein